MVLQNYIENQAERIESSLLSIAQIQKQLSELEHEVRVSQQINTAQKSAKKEVDEWLKKGEKLLKDMCSVFPKEALQDMVVAIQEMSDSISINYEEYQQSQRFLKGDVAQSPVSSSPEPEMVILEALPPIPVEESMPDVSDDTISLNQHQIEYVLQTVDSDVLAELKTRCNLNRINKLSTLASRLSERPLTYHQLNTMLKVCEQSLMFSKSFTPPATNVSAA